MSEIKHTPTPWIIEHGHMQQHTDIRYWQITDGQDAICNNQFCFARDSEANAAHIVKCVNMHDELVEALKLAHNGIVSYSRDDKEATVTMIREALKKAGAL